MKTQSSAPTHNNEEDLSLFESGSLDLRTLTDSQLNALAFAFRESREKMRHEIFTDVPQDPSYLLKAMTR